MRWFTLLAFALLVTNGSSGEETDNSEANRRTQGHELSEDSKIFYGNRLFSEKTCITCHLLEKEKLGPRCMRSWPSIKRRMQI